MNIPISAVFSPACFSSSLDKTSPVDLPDLSKILSAPRKENLHVRYFVTKIVQTYCEKKLLYLVIEKFKAEGREFAKFLRITRIVYSNSKRSEKFLVTECKESTETYLLELTQAL